MADNNLGITEEDVLTILEQQEESLLENQQMIDAEISENQSRQTEILQNLGISDISEVVEMSGQESVAYGSTESSSEEAENMSFSASNSESNQVVEGEISENSENLTPRQQFKEDIAEAKENFDEAMDEAKEGETIRDRISARREARSNYQSDLNEAWDDRKENKEEKRENNKEERLERKEAKQEAQDEATETYYEALEEANNNTTFYGRAGARYEAKSQYFDSLDEIRKESRQSRKGNSETEVAEAENEQALIEELGVLQSEEAKLQVDSKANEQALAENRAQQQIVAADLGISLDESTDEEAKGGGGGKQNSGFGFSSGMSSVGVTAAVVGILSKLTGKDESEISGSISEWIENQGSQIQNEDDAEDSLFGNMMNEMWGESGMEDDSLVGGAEMYADAGLDDDFEAHESMEFNHIPDDAPYREDVSGENSYPSFSGYGQPTPPPINGAIKGEPENIPTSGDWSKQLQEPVFENTSEFSVEEMVDEKRPPMTHEEKVEEAIDTCERVGGDTGSKEPVVEKVEPEVI